MSLVKPEVEILNPTTQLESFAEWFVRSPLAKTMIEGGQPFKIFLPVNFRENEAWGGVEITIACVTAARGATLEHGVAPPDRGNGHSSNPHGPLEPGDFGVHSHPDTANLPVHSAATERPPKKRRR